jgi:hypothetical protein
MQVEEFQGLISNITGRIAGKPLDDALMKQLNEEIPAGGDEFEELAAACKTGIAEGWLCDREMGGIKFGRVIKPGPETHGFSVDVVEMDDIKGPHHAHPNGEIDMVIPIEGDADFDGRKRGWLVYGPGTAHHPTVSGGKAIVLYLLPEGAIEFTKS